MNDLVNNENKPSLLSKIASRYSVSPDKLMVALKQTAFRQRDNKPVTDEQMMALMIVADQYELNPFTREIFAFPDNNGIVPVVSVDGWSRIINEHPKLDGIEFKYSDEIVEHKGKKAHEWIECHISRKDRAKPIIIREFFDEVVRELNYKTPWDTHPNRMHRHKTLIQCARIAFGFAGIYDEDEAHRIIEMGNAEIVDKRHIAQPQRKSEVMQKQNGNEVKVDQKPEPQKTELQGGLKNNHINLIKAQLERASITESELFNKFGVTEYSSIDASRINEILTWIKNP